MEGLNWNAEWTIETYHLGDLVDVSSIPGNVLTYTGASKLWEYAIGNGTGTSGQAKTYLNNANAFIGVGNGSTVTSPSQTALQGTSTLLKAMDATYPLHTDGAVASSASITFKSTFATTDANFAWEEYALFNGSGGAPSVMINRKTSSQGTKTSADSRVVTLSISLG